MVSADPLYRLGLALAIGLLVGVERHWQERDAPEGKRTAGIRTFGLTGLLGGLSASITGARDMDLDAAGALMIGASFLGFSAAFLVFKLNEARAEGRFSVTTVVAGQATFLLGVMAARSDPALVGAVAVGMTALLAARPGLHAFVAELTWPELRSAILLLSMTLVVWPLVPDRPLDTLGGVNPGRVWLMTVILAAVSYAGYVAERVIGPTRGVLASSAALGLLSSTAVTLANARAARAAEMPPKVLVAGALVAGAVSMLRTLALAWMLAPAMALRLMPALLLATIVHAAAVPLLTQLTDRGRPSTAPRGGNPFELTAVLSLALLLAVVEFLARAAQSWLGQGGVLAVSAISGVVDVDAVTYSLGGMVSHATVDVRDAAIAVGLAVGVNCLSKTVIATLVGGRGFGLAFALPVLGSVLGAAVLLLLA